MNVGLVLAIARYVPRAIVAVVAVALSYLLGLVAALPWFITVDENGREHIHPMWRWMTTHDAGIDEHFRGSYFKRHFWLGRYTQGQILASRFLRYVGRVSWIWRNPAYQTEHWLGFDQRGVEVPEDRFKDPRWDTGEENRSFWKVRNHRGQVGFLYQRQLHWGRDFSHIHRWLNLRFTLEMQFGWKLYRRDPDQRCMLAVRVSPFKRYGV